MSGRLPKIRMLCPGRFILVESVHTYLFQESEALRQQFQLFASFGRDRHKDESHITLRQTFNLLQPMQ